ncbi:MAG: type II CAAX endopeptidase family protein [Acidobacteriota bacterium]
MDETPQLPPDPEAPAVTEVQEVVNGAAEFPPPFIDPIPPPPPLPSAGAFTRDAILDLLAALGCFVLVVLAYAIVAAVSQFGFASQGRGMLDFLQSAWGIVALLLSIQFPLLYFALRRRRRNREKQRPLLPFFDGPWGSAARKGISAGLGLTVLSMLYTGLLQRLLGSESVPKQLDFLQNILNNRPAVAALVLIIAVLGPICEEIFFRGVVFGSAHASGRTTAGAVISAILFALVHVSPLLIPFYATFALVMCWLYAKTKTLVAPMAAHMTMNSIACLALLLAGGDQV